MVEDERNKERLGLRLVAADRQGLIDKVVGSIHQYVAAKYQELRFGAAVEAAFEVVRTQVDGAIAASTDALPMLSAAFENAASRQPRALGQRCELRAGGCSSWLPTNCRPAGDDITLPNGKTVKMGEGDDVNRLATWISDQTDSETGERMLLADLEFLGARLDAVDAAGQKGAHDATVTKEKASRYITGT